MKSFQTLISVFVLLLSLPAHGQDKVYDLLIKRDGSILEVQVVEDKPEEIVYRKKGEPEGPLYAIPKSDLLSAKYSDGETVSFTVTIDSFYSGKENTVSSPSSGMKPVYKALPPKNEFQKSILDLPNEGLEASYRFYKEASRSGKSLGILGTALHIGVNLVGSIIIIANSETDAFGNSYSTNEKATSAGSLMIIGGSLSGVILGPMGFIRAARNGNRAKFIRNEMKRRGIPVGRK